MDGLVIDRPEQVESRPDFQLGLVCLDNCTDNSDVNVFSADIVSRRNHCNVDIFEKDANVI